MMTFGMILLIVTGLLIAFGLGQRALDRLRLTDAQAYVFIAMIIVLGLVPEIPFGRVSVNAGGALVPLGMCVYLFIKADTARERWRSVLASVVTGAVIWAMMRFLPDEPDAIPFELNWLYGIAAAAVSYILGRSRRSAFIGGVVGVMLAQVASVVPVWLAGSEQRLVLGGAGVFDAVIVAGFLGVMIAEIVGEITERAVRGRQRPKREFRGGEFVSADEHNGGDN